MTDAIAWVDDRKAIRRRFTKVLKKHLSGRWRIVVSGPLENIGEYPSWIVDQGIAALVLDERLGDRAESGSEHVDYEGHDVVEMLRAKMPTLPIFIVTAAPTSADLSEKFGDVEDVIARSDFADRASAYTSRIQRAASRYVEQNRERLSRMMELASKSVSEGLSTSEKEELLSIRAYLEIDGGFEHVDQDDLLRRAETVLQDIESQLEALAARTASDARE